MKDSRPKYSRDDGHTWETPRYQRFANDRLMKHPRAANFAWRCENGKFLYWFHNHGGRFIREHPQRRSMAYQDRNPVWLCGGREADSPEGKIIQWTQPEILLYDDDPLVRMSYPDLVEEDGAYFITETQKDVARVHQIPGSFLHHLWQQFENESVTQRGLLLQLPKSGDTLPATVTMPRLPSFVTRSHTRGDHGSRDLRAGFSVELWFLLESLQPGQILLDNRQDNGKGFALQTTSHKTIEIVINDGRSESRWECDPGLFRKKQLHHLVAIVDGGPKIVSFVVDGCLNDGDTHRQFGWGRFNPNLRDVNGGETLRIAPKLQGQVRCLRLYGRYLLTSEAIGNYRAGPG